jgi:hypothetical protein
LIQAAQNADPGFSYVPIDFTVPTTGLIGQFLATANNYANGAVNLAANSMALLGYGTNGQLLLGSAGTNGYVSLNAGGFGTAQERVRITATGNVGIGTTTPNASARLDVTSSTQGFLPPRMTTTQRDAIVSPVAGLTIYCTNCTANDSSTGVTQTYNGSTWKNYW